MNINKFLKSIIIKSSILFFIFSTGIIFAYASSEWPGKTFDCKEEFDKNGKYTFAYIDCLKDYGGAMTYLDCRYVPNNYWIKGIVPCFRKWEDAKNVCDPIASMWCDEELKEERLGDGTYRAISKQACASECPATYEKRDGDNTPIPSDPDNPSIPIVCEDTTAEIPVSGKKYIFPLGVPYESVRMTNPFDGPPSSDYKTKHDATDFATALNTKVVASASGTIIQADFDAHGYGNYMIIRHVFTDGTYGETLYAHMSKMITINPTSPVNVLQGQEVGKLGSTGNSSGPHLHFEIRDCGKSECSKENRKWIDPMKNISFSDATIPNPAKDTECEEFPSSDPEIPEELKNVENPLMCMVQSAAQVANVPPQLLYAIARHESASSSYEAGKFICPKTWDSWRHQSDRTLCIGSPTEIAFASPNGYALERASGALDVRGLTQFTSGTFTGLIENTARKEMFDKCIDQVGARKKNIQPGDAAYDTGIPEQYRTSYSRHMIGQMFCATATKVLFDSGINPATNVSTVGNTPDWQEDLIRKVAGSYYGNCSSNYCDNIFATYTDATPLFKSTNYCAGKGNTDGSGTGEQEVNFEDTKRECNSTCKDCLLFPIGKSNPVNSSYSPSTVDITGKYPRSTSSETDRLTKDAADAFAKLNADAKNSGVNLSIVSSYRAYSYQDKVFKREVAKTFKCNPYSATIDKYSKCTTTIPQAEIKQIEDEVNKSVALPGSSEHQLGTALDLTCEGCTAFANDAGNQKVYSYLKNNATKFGFVISFPNSSSNEYIYEPWHIRYVGIGEAKSYTSSNSKTIREYLASKCLNNII